MNEVEKEYGISEEQSNNYIMPFGKWKGYKLWDIPNDYIRWLTNQSWLKPPLENYARAHREYQEIIETNRYNNCVSSSPYDGCENSMYCEMGYGELC